MTTQEYIKGIDALIQDGELDSKFKESSVYKSKLVNYALKDKLITPSNDKAGGLGTRAVASFLDDNRKMKYLEEQYGKDNVFNVDGQWIYKDGKNWYNFDSDNTEVADFTSDIAGDSVEMIPPILAETAGYLTTKNPYTASVMGGATLGVSSDVKDQLGEYFSGIPLDKSVSERVIDGATNAGVGTLASGAGLKAGEGIWKALNPNKSKYFSQQVQDRVNQAMSQGVQLTPAQALQSKKLGWIEDQMKNFGITADDWAKWIEQKQLNPINERISGLTPQSDNTQIGELIKKALKSEGTKAKKAVGAKYDALGEKSGTVNNDGMLNQALKILEEQKDVVPSARSEAYNVAKQIKDQATEVLNGNPILVPRDLPYQSAKQMRTHYGTKANDAYISGNNAVGREYQMIKDGIDRDITDQFVKAGNGAEADLAKKEFIQYADTYKNPTVRKITVGSDGKGLEPEKIVNNYFKPYNETQIAQIQKGANNPQIIDDAIMQGILNKSKDTLGEVSHRKFATQVNKMQPEIAMHTKSNQINDLGQVMDNIKFSDEFVNNSKTAYANGNNFLGGLAQLGSLVPRTLTSKAYLFPTTQKWLTQGLTNGSGNGLKVVGGDVGLIGHENTPILGTYTK